MGWSAADQEAEDAIQQRIALACAPLVLALTVIRDFPIPAQDNLLSANMRQVAGDALSNRRLDDAV
jgi:hypothetical protein